MDRKEASVTAILEGVDYLKTQFNNHMTDETNQVNEAYDSLSAGGLTSQRIDEIFGEIKTRINNLKQEFDTVKYLELLADKCVVYPDLHNVELQDFYNEMDSIKLLKKHLLNPGEYDDLMQKIQEINGYSLDDAVEEAKN